MYLYIPLEATVESLRVASYDAGRALRATKSIIAFLCEIGYFANCVFSGVRTPLFLVFTNPGKIVQPVDICRDETRHIPPQVEGICRDGIRHLGLRAKIFSARCARGYIYRKYFAPYYANIVRAKDHIFLGCQTYI